MDKLGNNIKMKSITVENNIDLGYQLIKSLQNLIPIKFLLFLVINPKSNQIYSNAIQLPPPSKLRSHKPT